MAHLFKAAAFYLASERRTLDTAVASIHCAQELVNTGHANEREKMLTQAVSQLVGGNWSQASQSLDQLLCQYPQDVFALQIGHVLDFFCGDAASLRNRPARVIPALSTSMPGYSYVLGMFAFGLEECNQYSQAEEWGLKALEIDPVDPWSVHAVTHVYEMQGRADVGVEFLESRKNNWANDNNFAYHNWWHKGLLHLELEEDQTAFELLDRHIISDIDDALVLLDVTAMLWRLYLLGHNTTSRFAPLADVWAEKMQTEVGFYAFNDYHAALSFVATEREQSLNTLFENMQAAAQSSSTPHSNILMLTKVGIPLVKSCIAYLQKDWVGSVDLLCEIRHIAHQFGGSHAQRDIVNLSLLSAAKKAQNDHLVRNLLNERSMLKPSGILGRRVVQGSQN